MTAHWLLFTHLNVIDRGYNGVILRRSCLVFVHRRGYYTGNYDYYGSRTPSYHRQWQGWNEQYENVADWKGHAGIVLSSFAISSNTGNGAPLLMSGGNDGDIKVLSFVRMELF